MAVSLNKLKGENENQYLWRIGNMIDDGYIRNWEAVLPVVNKELCADESNYKTESAYRKRYAAGKQFYNDVFSKWTDEDKINTLESKITELQNERFKLNATKVEYNRNEKQAARIELFYENIAHEIKTLKDPQGLFSHNDVINLEKQYVLTIADIHYGSRFAVESNEYNIRECENRFGRLFSEVKEFAITHKLDNLIIVNLGDEIQGLLRMTDLQLNETTVVKSVVGVSRLIAEFLNEASRYCTITYYSVPRSNHTQSRPLGSKANVLVSEDVTFIINNYIADLLSNNTNVNVVMPDSGKGYVEIPVYNFKVIAAHGNEIKNINTYLNDMSLYKREFIDYALIGHFHNKCMITQNNALCNDTEVIASPSFVGCDPYAESLMKSSKAACMILGFDKSKGLTETHKIILN